MRADIQSMLDSLKADAGLTDPAMIALLSRVMVDYSALQARAVAGQDVVQELLLVQATVANLDEHVRGVFTLHFQNWVQNLLATALGVAIAGA